MSDSEIKRTVNPNDEAWPDWKYVEASVSLYRKLRTAHWEQPHKALVEEIIRTRDMISDLISSGSPIDNRSADDQPDARIGYIVSPELYERLEREADRYV